MNIKPGLMDRVAVPPDPLAREEVRVMLDRAIRTDGTLRTRAVVEHLTSDWQVGSTTEIVDDDVVIQARFMPTPRDWQNYLPVMGWFCALADSHKPRRLDALNAPLSLTQRIVVLRAYELSYAMIGDRVDRTKQRVHVLYREAVTDVWQLAIRRADNLARLPRALWDGSNQHGSRTGRAF